MIHVFNEDWESICTLTKYDFVPTIGDFIIYEEQTYEVVNRCWNEDTMTSTILVSKTDDPYGIRDCSEDSELAATIHFIREGNYFCAVKRYKETFKVGLKEAKEWVDEYRKQHNL